MKKWVLGLYEGHGWLKLALLGVAVALYLAVSAYSGVSPLAFLWFCLVVAVYVVLPGALVEGWLGGAKHREPAPGEGNTRRFHRVLFSGNAMPAGFAGLMALLYGVGLFAVLYCLCMRLNLMIVLHVLPPVLSALWLAGAIAERWLGGAKHREPAPGEASQECRAARASKTSEARDGAVAKAGFVRSTKLPNPRPARPLKSAEPQEREARGVGGAVAKAGFVRSTKLPNPRPARPLKSAEPQEREARGVGGAVAELWLSSRARKQSEPGALRTAPRRVSNGSEARTGAECGGLAERGRALLCRVKAWHIKPHQGLLVLLYAALLVLFTFYGPAKNGHPLAVGDVLPNQDLYWNTGNAASFGLAFPPQDIRYVDVRLHYHYLTELVAGALSLVSGLAPYDILAFYLQPLVLAALVLGLYRFGRLVFENSQFKAMLFTLSMFLFSCVSLWKILPNGLSVFWNANIIHLVTNINSQATAIVVLCGFMGMWVHAARRRYRVGLLYWAAMLCVYVLLCFAKGPLAALVAAAAVLAAVVGLISELWLSSVARKQSEPTPGEGCPGRGAPEPQEREARGVGGLISELWLSSVARKQSEPTPVRGLLLGVGFSLLLAGLFWVIYTSMFASGANDSMTFTLHGTLEKGWFYNILERVKQTDYEVWKLILPLFCVLQSLLMLPAQFPLYLRGVARDVRHFAALSQEKLFFNAMAVGGLAAYFLFNHPHMSQTYFLYAAIFFVNLLAVGNVDYVREWYAKARGAGVNGAARDKRRADGAHGALKKWLYRVWLAGVTLLAAAGVATTAFLYIHMGGSGLNQLARNLGIQQKYPYELVLSADDEAAMLWLRENSPAGAMFATNRIHTGGRREGISNVYSAMSGRQAFMEGFQYAKTNMGVPADDIAARLALNTALFSAGTPLEEIERICRTEGISYLVFCTQMNGVDASDTQLAALEKVWDSPGVRIYWVGE